MARELPCDREKEATQKGKSVRESARKATEIIQYSVEYATLLCVKW